MGEVVRVTPSQTGGPDRAPIGDLPPDREPRPAPDRVPSQGPIRGQPPELGPNLNPPRIVQKTCF
jgi:hypothetical protein